MFWRNPSAAFFNFLLPLLLPRAASARSSQRPGGPATSSCPGIAGMSVMATTFNALANNITFLREQGMLKRMRGTPLPPASYLPAIAGNAVTNAVDPDRAIVVLAGQALLRHRLAQGLARAGRLRRAGVVCFASLGVALLARDPELRRGAGLHEHRLPAGRSSSRASSTTSTTRPAFLQRHRRRAAARAPDRRPVAARWSRGARAGGQPWATLGVVLACGGASALAFAVRGFSWEQRRD